MKEPPDPDSKIGNLQIFRTVKVPLKSILKHQDLIQPKIEDAVIRANQFATLGYEFLKMYVLYCCENQLEIPKIHKALFKKIFRLIGQGKPGRPPKSTQACSLTSFYHIHFSAIYPDKIDSCNMSYVLDPMIDEMIRCLETNISTHFKDYVNRFVNVTFKEPRVNEIRETYPNKADRKPHYTQLNKEMYELKWDFLSLKCEKCDPKYHDWLNARFNQLFPFKRSIKHNLAYDVKANTQRYISPSIEINKQLEALGKKPYQVIPVRSSYVPKAVTFNTSGIVEVINDKKKQIYKFGYTEMNNHTKRYQKHVWKEIMKLEKRGLFKDKRKSKNDFVFFNQFSTDGVSANILFIRKEYANKKWTDKVPEYDESKAFDVTKLESLNSDSCDKLKDRVLIGIDPGKCDLFTMAAVKDSSTENEKGKYQIHSYSNRRRQIETYAFRSKEVLQIEKRKHSITEIETTLSRKTRKNSLDLGTYTQYVNAKNEVKEQLDSFYQRPLFRKMALRRYVKTMSSEEKMLNEIEERFGAREDLLLGLGNWSLNDSANRVKGCNATPNKRLVKLLKRRFEVVSVDEYNTSKLYNKDPSVVLDNVMMRKKGRKRRSKFHRLLTPKRNPNGVIVNRDTNAAKNILNILSGWIMHQRRPLAFCRPKNDRVATKQPEGNQV